MLASLPQYFTHEAVLSPLLLISVPGTVPLISQTTNLPIPVWME